MMERRQEVAGWQEATDLSVAAVHTDKLIARSRGRGPARDPQRVAVSVPSKIAEVMGNTRRIGGLNPESRILNPESSIVGSFL
jgi:hypothetical protein